MNLPPPPQNGVEPANLGPRAGDMLDTPLAGDTDALVAGRLLLVLLLLEVLLHALLLELMQPLQLLLAEKQLCAEKGLPGESPRCPWRTPLRHGAFQGPASVWTLFQLPGPIVYHTRRPCDKQLSSFQWSKTTHFSTQKAQMAAIQKANWSTISWKTFCMYCMDRVECTALISHGL